MPLDALNVYVNASQHLKSPVILLLEVADGDESRGAAQSELVLQGRPLDAGRRPVDPDQHQRGLPDPVLQAPDVGVTIRGTRHDAVGLGGPVDSCGDG